MSNQERVDYIKELRNKRMTYVAIGKLLNLSRQRVHQIFSGYIPKSKKKIYVLSDLNLSAKKFQHFNDFKFKTEENPNSNGVSGGKDYVREWVRIRDNHACQICFRKWRKGMRRFDVHHLDEERESLDNKGLRPRDICKWDKEHMDRMVTLCHKCHLNLDHIRNKMSKSMRKRHASVAK